MKVCRKDGIQVESLYEEALGKEAFLNTAAFLLGLAVKRVFPSAISAQGMASKDGFYYDFEFDFEFTPDMLEKIETEMHKLVKEDIELQWVQQGRKDVIEYMEREKNPYKLQLILESQEEERISFIKHGDYFELCAGAYATHTSLIQAFQLTTIAGAYWDGKEDNKMLTRIYGIAFPKKEQLQEHILLMEEIKRRDHRKLGKDLGLFELMEEGPGFPFFLPKGLVLKNLLIGYWRRIHEREDYKEISTPMILNRELWETSGHWDHYRENMYTTEIDSKDFAIKPMNCPGGLLVYKMQPHSYRELPLRIGELGLVHRHEKSGVLHGLMRVRCFTQDDAHIFMTKEQIPGEIQRVIHLIDEVYHTFGFEYSLELSTKPENSIGSEEEWILATEGLKKALDAFGKPYVINEGDGAFYGPKIDFHLKDSLGRTWQCGTIQLDFQLPQRFQAEYIGADGQKHRPIMIHRVVFGSIERMIGILIEHYAGKFPLWMAPVQVKILPIADRFYEYAEMIKSKLRQYGIRSELDLRKEKIGYKIREAQLDKVPYMIIVGQKEMDSQKVSIRKRDEGDLGSFNLEEFIRLIQEEIKQ
ncbi:threonine--tRNA ligase [Clostridium sp. E02]|uniref:threonine--tRNA ligase n=1 Tax=Clostridium sp. E02 TaxID=2487134 RepID=UPI000F52E42D|nr:threonine--tRNA ligase [Clostridium sp. E02]